MWLNFAVPGRVILVVILLALLGAGFWFWQSARSSSAVSEEDALSGFRQTPAAGAAKRRGAPRPGVYTYRQSGEERGGLGPVSIPRGLPDEARYVVTGSAGGYQEELSLSEQHVEGIRFRVTPTGTRAVWRRTDITFAGFGRDDRRDLRPPPLHLPRRLPVGRSWSGRYRAGSLPVTYRSEVLRREAVEVGGERLPTIVVRTVGDTGGAHPGTRVDTFWWSPRLALPLRWTIDMEIRGTASLDTQADLRLEALEPLT